MAVRNADFEAVVYSRPTVCVANPMKRSTPRMPPLTNDRRFNDLSFGKENTPNRIDARMKRKDVYTNGDASSSADFVIANVLPQINVTRRRNTSAFVRVFIDSRYGSARPSGCQSCFP
jgi:hypothetical protein